MTSPAVLEALGVSKAFSGTLALSDVDFRLERGRVHALIGENGAGKSTLLGLLSGIEQPTRGELRLDGQPVRFSSAREASLRGISIIHQELQLFPDMTVSDNLFVGRERRTRWGTIDRDAQEAAARGALRRLGQALSPRTLLGRLPLGQQQIVEIARALVHDARVLLMDEPTSALSGSEIPTLFRVIRDLAAQGVSIVYISHRLEELIEIADHVSVLRDGRLVGEAPASEVDVAWIVRRMTGRDSATRPDAAASTPGAPLLRTSSLRLPARPGRTGLEDVSFELRSGEILGLYGLMGAGRTELLESLLGVHADASGDVVLLDRSLAGLGVSARVAAGLAMVPEDRKAAGLVPTLTVRENLTLSSLDRIAPHGHLRPEEETRAAQPWVESLRVRAPSLTAPIGTLSGGNQQKLILARAAMSRPRVLLMDEPTRGVDVAAKQEIVESMRRLAREGMGIVFATSDLAEVEAVATRVLAMARGRITGRFEASQATADALASAASRPVGGGDVAD
jgi:erythritol transport system ATP-binding protein